MNSIDWTNYVKLLNEYSGAVEAAMCMNCKIIIQHYNNERLNVHRQNCPLQVQYDAGDHPAKDSPSDTMDIDVPEIKELSRTDITRLLTKFFVACNIPFRVVESEYFRNFYNAVCEMKFRYKLPCRQTLSSSYVPSLHLEIVDHRKGILRNTSSVLIVDGWKNKSINRKYLVFTLTNINTPQTFLTFFDSTLDSEDGETLAQSINEAIRIAKEMYETDVYAIISDNDRKIKCGGRLAENYDKQPLWQTTCSSHSGNLLLKSVVDDRFAETIRDIVSTFRNPKLETLLCDQGGTKLKNYPDTRFCYFRDTCESVLKNLSILQKICLNSDFEIEENIKNTLVDSNIQAKLTDTVKTLEDICKLINKCQDPTFKVADAVHFWLSIAASNLYDKDIVNERIKNALWPVAYAAYLLHPEYQGSELDEGKLELAYKFFSDHWDAVTLRELDSFFNNRHKEVKILIDRCKDPISFWRLCHDYYPNLSDAAVKLMILPASTAQLESLFSNWSFIHDAHRNRLTNRKSEQLVDIYYSLRH